MSFVYPKNSYKLNVNVETKQLNQNEFNIGQFISHIARSITKKFSFVNPFQLSGSFSKTPSTTSTTTDSSIDFSEEITDAIDTRIEDTSDLFIPNFSTTVLTNPTTRTTNLYLPPTIPPNRYLPGNMKRRYL